MSIWQSQQFVTELQPDADSLSVHSMNSDYSDSASDASWVDTGERDGGEQSRAASPVADAPSNAPAIFQAMVEDDQPGDDPPEDNDGPGDDDQPEDDQPSDDQPDDDQPEDSDPDNDDEDEDDPPEQYGPGGDEFPNEPKIIWPSDDPVEEAPQIRLYNTAAYSRKAAAWLPKEDGAAPSQEALGLGLDSRLTSREAALEQREHDLGVKEALLNAMQAKLCLWQGMAENFQKRQRETLQLLTEMTDRLLVARVESEPQSIGVQTERPEEALNSQKQEFVTWPVLPIKRIPGAPWTYKLEVDTRAEAAGQAKPEINQLEYPFLADYLRTGRRRRVGEVAKLFFEDMNTMPATSSPTFIDGGRISYGTQHNESRNAEPQQELPSARWVGHFCPYDFETEVPTDNAQQEIQSDLDKQNLVQQTVAENGRLKLGRARTVDSLKDESGEEQPMLSDLEAESPELTRLGTAMWQDAARSFNLIENLWDLTLVLMVVVGMIAVVFRVNQLFGSIALGW